MKRIILPPALPVSRGLCPPDGAEPRFPPVDLASPGNVNKRSTATYSGLAPAISGNGRVTFVISSNEQDGSAFYSREDGTASRRPLLNVTYWSY